MGEFIFGRNAVLEAVEMKIPLRQVLLASSLKDRNKIGQSIRSKQDGIKINIVDRIVVDKKSREGVRTGGICAELAEVQVFTSLDRFMGSVRKTSDNPMILAVDSIQDPRNFGAIIRSAAGAGFHGIVFPKDRQVDITGVAATTSAGACFRIPMCRTVNLARALDELRDLGYWVYGADSGDYTSIYKTSFAFPLVLVVGSEGKGMRPLVKKKCNEIVAIPLSGSLESLNVSVAAGIVMFEIARQRLEGD